MADQARPAHPRIALIFGDAASVAHLRDAVREQVEIVYDTPAADFDAARLADSRATAALVNIDGDAWLDAIEAKLNETDVAVVFNDPEISRGLEGWAQARWLRHLTAKLSGSSDFDPPRPRAETPQAETAESIVPAASETAAVEVMPTSVNRPLSPAEIASMTVDFVQPEPSAQAAIAADDVLAGTDTLDLDTEALSAMIDARLAESEGHAAIETVPVWSDVAGAVTTPAAPVEVVASSTATEPAAAPMTRQLSSNDDGVPQALPALGDWALLDPDAPVAAAPARAAAKATPAISPDFAGLELVPIEATATVAIHSEPVEHHLYNTDDRAGSNEPRAAMQSTGGGHA